MKIQIIPVKEELELILMVNYILEVKKEEINKILDILMYME